MKKFEDLKPGDIIYECGDPEFYPFWTEKQIIKEIIPPKYEFISDNEYHIYIEGEEDPIMLNPESPLRYDTFYQDYFGNYVCIDPESLKEFFRGRIENIENELTELKKLYEQI